MQLHGFRRYRSLIVAVATVLVLALLLYWKAEQNYHGHDYVNTNFFSFWLSGHMAWTGESPYDTSRWMAGFDEAEATYRPSKILQYPLPLMYFMAPIGWLPVGQAYFVWQVVCQLAIALTVFLLLRLSRGPTWLVAPVMAFLLFFGPVYLSLQIGSVGVISLLAVALAILLLETERPLLAGLILSATLLKPPQALPLLLLVCIWLLARRKWHALGGLVLGGLVLLVVWMLRDPMWLSKFRGSSDFLLGRSLGVQANVFGFAYVVCDANQTCMWGSGALATLLILGTGAYLLWRNRDHWTDWQAFNLVIPLGFLTAVYLWSYDQLLYIIPIVWILVQFLKVFRSYIPAFLFLITVDAVSLVALAVEAYTHQDFLSLMTTLLILGCCAWLLGKEDRFMRARSAASTSGAAPQE